MATELITDAADQQLHRRPRQLAGGRLHHRRPSQDIMDQMTANVFDTFLGIAHVNCLLCHNGRGHLDTLSLWGSQHHPLPGLATVFVPVAHAGRRARPVDPSNTNVYYWSVQDNTKGYTVDYTLNTTTGNRPARVAPAGMQVRASPATTCRRSTSSTATRPRPERTTARRWPATVTGDFQFARATVNYIWAQFFGMGMVDPPDTFDPARLDPDNPPPAPWTLQPTNAAPAERAGAAFRRQRLRPEGADARDRELPDLPAFQPLQRHLERRLGTLLRAQVRAAAVGRRGARRRGAIERHLPDLYHDRLHRPGLPQA